MPQQLIINADDFGWDGAANAAIFNLAAARKLTSVTVLANCVEISDLKQLSRLPVGIGAHLNVITGVPLSPRHQVKTLVDAEGCFYPAAILWGRYLCGLVRAAEIQQEIQAQILFLRQHGVVLTHVDSHQHVHQYPFLCPLILQVVENLGIKAVRRCHIVRLVGNTRKMRILQVFSYFTRQYLKKFHTPDVLLTDFSAAKQADMRIFQAAIQAGFQAGKVVEWMAHPGVANREDSYLNRCAEYEFWLAAEWEEYLKAQGISLISYADLY